MQNLFESINKRLDIPPHRKPVKGQFTGKRLTVLKLFQQYPDARLSVTQVMAFAIKQKLMDKNVLLTSVRWAVSTLATDHKLLIKLDETRIGPHGLSEHLYQLNPEQ